MHSRWLSIEMKCIFFHSAGDSYGSRCKCRQNVVLKFTPNFSFLICVLTQNSEILSIKMFKFSLMGELVVPQSSENCFVCVFFLWSETKHTKKRMKNDFSFLTYNVLIGYTKATQLINWFLFPIDSFIVYQCVKSIVNLCTVFIENFIHKFNNSVHLSI